MNTKSINRRLDDLERDCGKHGFIVVCPLEGETSEQAIERTMTDGGFTERDRENLPMIVFPELLARG
jgi:hypothetical protein